MRETEEQEPEQEEPLWADGTLPDPDAERDADELEAWYARYCVERAADSSLPVEGEPTAPYVGSENIDPALRDELREWQTASAHTFHRFEAALDDNSEHFDTGPALSFEDALRVGGCPVSPPRVEGLPEWVREIVEGARTSGPHELRSLAGRRDAAIVYLADELARRARERGAGQSTE